MWKIFKLFIIMLLVLLIALTLYALIFEIEPLREVSITPIPIEND